MSDKVYWRDVYDAVEKRVEELEHLIKKTTHIDTFIQITGEMEQAIKELEDLKRYLDKGGLLEQVLNNIKELEKKQQTDTIGFRAAFKDIRLSLIAFDKKLKKKIWLALIEFWGMKD